ncbi:glucan biosynthesis protein [Stieleria varia]|uniref:Glucans biosynthesis protein G n=1 Tax=Stieleria varia TaxID=2528005 RepID=A0A5C6ATQ9_9BACT|nr:glucan biosynthesis protein [Stieleria varia]TWU02968.1 Glucans biosynthesis protein G precursor [Stieleria varia]
MHRSIAYLLPTVCLNTLVHVVMIHVGLLSDPVAAESPAENALSRQTWREIDSFERLDLLTQSLATLPFVPRRPLPEPLAKLDYEQYREISFRPEQGVWWKSGSPFCLETFHRGFVQKDRVDLFTIDDDGVHEVLFSPKHFVYGIPIEDSAELLDSGHAGVKVVGRIPGLGDPQEFLTFLGSSYFRARSCDTVYGASARGLAVNVGLPCDEEFPFFRAFWVRAVEPDCDTLTVLALMDSPSMCGAYEFVLQPGGVETTVAVKSRLHFRSIPEKIGLAPLTSMWMWGDGLDGPSLDKRPGVHDSDGLLIRSDEDDWTWRAFARQSYPSVSTVPTEKLLGFGVLQRNRAFFHYDDHNAQYHKRPSIWIEPNRDGSSDGVWENGRVELLELPGAHEGIDNIAAYWVPQQTPKVGDPLDLNYVVKFFPGDCADQSKIARVTHLDVDRKKDRIGVTARFSGETIRDLSFHSMTIDVSLIRGELVSKSIERTDTGDWLASIEFRPTEEAPVEVSMRLMSGPDCVTERLQYLCPNEQPEFMYPQVYTRKE